MGNIFGGVQQQETSTTEPPQYLKKAIKGAVGGAQQVAGLPYQTSQLPRLAGFTPDQQAGFELTRQETGRHLPLLEGARQMTLGGATPFTQADMGAYMDPYIGTVLGETAREVTRSSDIQGLGESAAAAKAGAFGGSRHGILGAERERNLQRTIRDVYESGLSGAFGQARNQFGQDRAAMAQAGQQLGGLAGTGQFLGFNAANQLGQQGGLQQALMQSGLNISQQEMMALLGTPEQRARFLTQQLGGLSGAAGVNQQQVLQDSGGNAAAGILGLIGTGVGAYFGGPAGAAAGGSVGSSIGGAF